jgi:hypothetical protein
VLRGSGADILRSADTMGFDIRTLAFVLSCAIVAYGSRSESQGFIFCRGQRGLPCGRGLLFLVSLQKPLRYWRCAGLTSYPKVWLKLAFVRTVSNPESAVL